MPIAVSSSTNSARNSPSVTSSSAPAPAPAPPTSRNPVRVTVAQRDHNLESNHAGPSSLPDTDGRSTLRKAAVRKVQLQRKSEKWMDRLMEDTVDRTTFKRATSHLTPPQYLEITHERHLNSLCSYPLCPNPPARPYSTAKRFVISTRARTIKPTSGNEEDGYCCKRCKVRSTWVERRLNDEAVWLRTSVEEVDLLEDLEERGEFQWDKSGNKPTSKLALQKSAAQAITNPVTPSKDSATSTNPVTALIASLAIHERPTPATPPTPPSLIPPPAPTPTQPTPPSAAAQPRPSPRPASTPSKASTPSRDARRTASAIMPGSTAKLATTLVSATRSVGPIQQLGEDTDEESEESDWEKEMAWGDEDEEMKALFEEARMARELMAEGA